MWMLLINTSYAKLHSPLGLNSIAFTASIETKK